MANIPVDTPLVSVNRFCSSGLEAVAIIASKIIIRMIEVGIGAGCESMSLNEMSDSVKPDLLSDAFLENQKSQNCLLPMGMCSEILTKKYGFKRENLDKFAMNSQKKAKEA